MRTCQDSEYEETRSFIWDRNLQPGLDEGLNYNLKSVVLRL
jgi:hypothetical protein